MTASIRRPGPPLSSFVDCFWFVDGSAVPEERERVLPDGAMQLIVGLRGHGFRTYGGAGHDRERRLGGAILTGPRDTAAVINSADTVATVGVAFRPGWARPFFGAPAAGFRSTEIDLDAVWGSSAASELHERILAARSPEAAFAVLEEILLARLNGRWLPHPAVAHAMQAFAGARRHPSIGQVVEEVGLSQRRFIALFDRAVGLTPKLFCRVRRFQDALGQVGHRPDWADVAAACGYADQAHLIRDFRAFSGLTPGEYLRLRTEQRNHVSLGARG